LPGSRKQEIQKLLPIMLSVAPHFPDYEFVVAGLSSVDKKLYQPIFQHKNAHLVYDQTYALLKHSYAAIVKSGTSTLETALFKVPQVVCYAVNPLTYFLARMLVSVNYISLVNLLLNRQSVTELIQGDFNTQNLTEELKKLVSNENRTKILNDYDELARLLKEKGCSERIALKMIHLLQSK
jgi:lipid-A-disaccharide synthase